MTTQQFQVRKDQLATTRTVQLPQAPLADGEIRVRIEHFAYTSNNITYAAFGDAMNYWQFFPVAPAAGDAVAWGVVPVWGFGVVEQTQCAGVAVGERLYGYWPMASHAVLNPARLSPEGFSDGAPHRAALHPVYNNYLRCAVDPLHDPATEPLQALLRPLFLTAWLIDDFLADNDFYGTSRPGQRGVMLLSSASSKTACATAAQLAHRPEVEVVGLTSPGNVVFCESLGVYSRVLTYDQLDQLPQDTPCVYVDFAGNGALRKAIHGRFTALAYSCSIGGTHVDQLAGGRDLAGPRPVLFFAPAQVKKRHGDWGAAGFNERMAKAWHAFIAQVSQPAAPWLVVQHHNGPAAVQAAHALVLGGRGDARVGHMLSLP
ncbi:DUF2855 family protein [Hydrogenophaga sp.]|uniref:DUF2855 family protein n=1 Tax=Hydrogenophaga sp. TaxID=1904254 RepID=UPI0027303D5E|nr:DUF2855 family protein [Hydrogenophaga sp.]MDP2016085.1 DUF2855 family protein [Hydrogenophaga sp.]MDP3167776.1 DUF2855 family protein [Hydrogenophaga sp.]MDP3810331.1 DUF2855 family protein [Hydrogenophaga sp.]